MKIDFDNNYIILVVLFMMFVWFARNLLELLQTVCQMLEHCSCCAPQCIGYNAHYVCNVCMRQALAVYCFLQPLLLCVANVVHNAKNNNTPSTVMLCDVAVNTTAFADNATIKLDMLHSTCSVIDFVLVAIPYACMVSISTLCWVKLTSMGELNEDTLWDDGIYTASEHGSVFYYDLIYFVEIWCMNFAFVLGSTNGSSFWHLYYTGHAITVGMVFFVANARYPRDNIMDHWVGTLVSAYLLSVMIPFWNNTVSTKNTVCVALAATHAFCVFLIVAGHFMAMGVSTAGYVLALRVVVTVVASTTLSIVLLVGHY